MSRRNLQIFCGVLITLAIAAKFYGVTDPWKTHDHYNFGGVWTTTYAECLKSTPLSVSHGVPAVECWTDHPGYYPAHPPTILFAMWGWTSVFGSSEASYRSFIALFSILNVALIFLIARLARPESWLFPWLAAVFQSGFLGGLYFGTHPDFIGEFTVFFVLLTGYFALQRRMTAAGLMALLAGISSWPGYLCFLPLWLFAFSIRHGRKRIFLTGAFALCLALGSMMWLHQTTDIAEFLKHKLLSPGYVTKREKGWLEPLHFFVNFIRSQARLLSPVFAAFALFEVTRQKFPRLSSFELSREQQAWLLTGGTGLTYMIVGHEYFMVHVFLYLLLTPALALAAASFTERALTENRPLFDNRRKQILMTVLILSLVSLYPYGIFQSRLGHDIANSALLIGSGLYLIYLIWRNRTSAPGVLVLVGVGVCANISQMTNYRNEPDTERSFCESARAEYQQTHLPVRTHEPRSSAKDFLYCRGIEIEYLKPSEP